MSYHLQQWQCIDNAESTSVLFSYRVMSFQHWFVEVRIPLHLCTAFLSIPISAYTLRFSTYTLLTPAFFFYKSFVMYDVSYCHWTQYTVITSFNMFLYHIFYKLAISIWRLDLYSLSFQGKPRRNTSALLQYSDHRISTGI